MDDAIIREKLSKCFSAAFPELTSVEIESANIENTSGWDSIAHVTLLVLVSEEFHLELDFDVFANIDSFSGFAHLLKEATS